MAEGNLVRRGLEGKFIGGHGFDGGGHVFGGAGEAQAQGVADGSCGGSGRWRWRLSSSKNGNNRKQERH